MIRHVVMFRWKRGTAADVVETVVAGLRTMPESIPEIRDYRFGADLGINDANWDFVVVADFATADDYVTYRDDPGHRALIAEAIAPHLEERASVQYELDVVVRHSFARKRSLSPFGRARGAAYGRTEAVSAGRPAEPDRPAAGPLRQEPLTERSAAERGRNPSGDGGERGDQAVAGDRQQGHGDDSEGPHVGRRRGPARRRARRRRRRPRRRSWRGARPGEWPTHDRRSHCGRGRRRAVRDRRRRCSWVQGTYERGSRKAIVLDRVDHEQLIVL